MSIYREVQQSDGTWRRQDGKAVKGAKSRWRARQKVRDWDGVEAYRQAYGVTQQEAKVVLERKVADFLKPKSDELSSTMTVGELADIWLEHRKTDRDAGNMSYNTFVTYERVWHRHLLKPFGSLRVDGITKGTIARGLRKINDEVGNGAAKSCRSVMVGIFKLALEDDILQVSPAADISLPASKRKIVNALSPARVKTLRQFIWDDRRGVKEEIRLLMELQLATGARIGEVCGLMWEYLDFEAENIFVVHNVVRKAESGLHLETTKTLTSDRTLRMTSRIKRLLQERQQQVQGDVMVLRAPLGGLMDPSNAQYQCRVVMRALAAETGDEKWLDVTSHTLRRTAGTLLLSGGMPINEVADFLGHSDIGTTLSHYVGRNLDEGSERAAQLLDWNEDEQAEELAMQEERT